MASQINASNSGFGGIVSTGDSSGVLQLQTAGTTAVTIDSSQNVGIGTTSPGTKLSLNGVMWVPASNFKSVLDINSTNSQAAGNGAGITLGGVYTGTSPTAFAQIAGIKENSTDGNYAGALAMYYRPNGNTLAEGMRIDSSGNVLIGQTTNTQGGRLVVKGSSGSDDDLVFNSSSTYSEIQSFNSKPLILNRQGNEIWIAGTTDRGAFNLQCNGTGVWGAGAYTNGSDVRIKDDIQPITSSLEVVNKLNPVTFKYKEDWSKDQSVQTGFIAQELQETLKDEIYIDGLVNTGGEYLSVAYQNIIPLLTKAIQEQQTIINDLKARVTALEAK